MDAAIIAAWNAVVCQSDNVYVLGDVSFAGIERTCAILKRLAGRKHLVAGNHDQYMRRKEPFRDCFEWVVDYHELAVVDEALPDGKQHIVMCHFPLVAWHRSRYGAWMLHGHMHGKLGHNQDMRRHDVGVDVNDFAPVSYDALVQRFVGCPAPTRD